MSNAYTPRHRRASPRSRPVLPALTAAILAALVLAAFLVTGLMPGTGQLPAPALSSPQAAASAPASAHASTSTPASHAAPQPRPRPLARYTVRPGDSLWLIALAHYGSGTGWERIWAANRAVIGSDPGHILPGQVITVPRR